MSISGLLSVIVMISIISINTSFAQNTSNGVGFTVVELFTSEGCSSCPAAEKVCSKLQNEFKNVYFLEFHVDYWNYLGWKDEYSDVAFTKRQQDYVRSFGLNSSYTPQAIVNGTKQMVGSDNDKLRGAILGFLYNKPAVNMEIRATITGKFITVSYNTNDPDCILNIALVQLNAETNVRKGENAGRKLVHNNVVRAFKTIPFLKGQRDVTVELPIGMSKENARIIGYLQKKNTNEVIAAKEIEII